MDEITVIFLTLSANLFYQLVHYTIRKLSECQEIDLFCFIFRRNNDASIKNKRSSESDKDAVTEITLK